MWRITIVLLSVLMTTSAHIKIIDLPLVNEQSKLYDVIDGALKLILFNDLQIRTDDLFNDTIRTVSEIQLSSDLDPYIDELQLLLTQHSESKRKWSHLNQGFTVLRELYKTRREPFLHGTHIFINAVQSVLEHNHEILLSRYKNLDNMALLEIFHKNATEHDRFRCGSISLQSLFYRLYQTILKSDAQGFTAMISAFLHTSQFEVSNNKMLIVELASKYLMRIMDYVRHFEKVLTQVSTNVDLCDPPHPKRNETFIELEGAIQMTIVRQVALSEIFRQHATRICKSPGYNVIPKSTLDCQSNETHYNNWCPLRPCRGLVSDCVSATHLKFGELPRGFSRRYTSIKYEDAFQYGSDNSTEVIEVKQHSVRSRAHSYLSAFRTCDLCICTCTESNEYSEVIRTISLRPVLSNIKKNMVVTGLRFILTDGVIQIQIQENKLLPYGQVSYWDDNSQLVPCERFDRRDNGTIFLQNGTEENILVEEIDYTYIAPNRKTINLDDLVSDHNYVVTGVKIGNTIDIYGPPRMRLEIHTTKFDFRSGTLSQKAEDSFWKFADNDNFHRSGVSFGIPDSPLNVHEPHNVYSARNKYVSFRSSDRFIDAAQTTIPVFDAQSAVLSDDQPLSGVGLIHRGVEGSGGYLAFRLYALNLGKYWDL